MPIPIDSFKASERTVPADNFWDIQSSRSIDAIRIDLDTRVNVLPRQSLLADAFELNARSVASAQAGATVEHLKVANRDDILAEALDCYNQKIQDAASINAHLSNLENVQKINTVEMIPVDARADAYKKIFGNCCPTPQNIICNCNTPNPDA